MVHPYVRFRLIIFARWPNTVFGKLQASCTEYLIGGHFACPTGGPIMDSKRISGPSHSYAGRKAGDPDLTSVTRRDWLRVAAGGSVGLALGGLLDLPKVRAATQEF